MTATPDNDISGQYLARAHTHAMTSFGRIRNQLRNDRGAVMAEYGLLIALIAVMLITMLLALNGTITDMFTEPTETLNTVNTSVTTP